VAIHHDVNVVAHGLTHCGDACFRGFHRLQAFDSIVLGTAMLLNAVKPSATAARARSAKRFALSTGVS